MSSTPRQTELPTGLGQPRGVRILPPEQIERRLKDCREDSLSILCEIKSMLK